jgi:hypothetical protein
MKYFVSLTVLCLAITFSSCTKTVHTTEVVQAPSQVVAVAYDIRASNWQLNNTAGYYVALNVPEITQDVVDAGGVIVYLSFDNGQSYEALPEVYGDISYTVWYYAGGVEIYMDPAISAFPELTNTFDVIAKILIINPE